MSPIPKSLQRYAKLLSAMSEPSKAEKFPTLLSRAEALQWAATETRRMAENIELSVIALEMIDDATFGAAPAEARAVLAEIKKSLVDPELQKRVMLEAADEISRLAMEERLFAAKRQAGAPPSA